MAVLLKNGAIGLHIPKTGGFWVQEVLERLGLVRTPTRDEHTPLPGFTYPVEQAAFKFAFVRHPLDWYESWWRRQTDGGWKGWFTEAILPPCAFTPRLGFNEFVAQCLAHAPGMVSALYELYVGPPEAPIKFIGKTETVLDDLIRLLNQMQVPYVREVIEATPPQNVSLTPKPAWDAALRQEVAAAEQRAMARFGYV